MWRGSIILSEHIVADKIPVKGKRVLELGSGGGLGGLAAAACGAKVRRVRKTIFTCAHVCCVFYVFYVAFVRARACVCACVAPFVW